MGKKKTDDGVKKTSWLERVIATILGTGGSY